MSSYARFEKIYEKIDQIRKMIGDGNHRHFALVSLSNIESFIQVRKGGLQDHEKVKMVYVLNLIIERLEGLSREIKMEFATNKVKDSIILAKNMLLA